MKKESYSERLIKSGMYCTVWYKIPPKLWDLFIDTLDDLKETEVWKVAECEMYDKIERECYEYEHEDMALEFIQLHPNLTYNEVLEKAEEYDDDWIKFVSERLKYIVDPEDLKRSTLTHLGIKNKGEDYFDDPDRTREMVIAMKKIIKECKKKRV